MLFNLIYPKKCLDCGKKGKYICINCISRQPIALMVCPHCFKPSLRGLVHIRCGRKVSLSGSTSIWKYQGVVKKAIKALKYKYAEEVSLELAEYGAYFLKRASWFKKNKDVILVPIPSHTKRKNWRGFNQAESIGKIIAKKLNWQYTPNLLLRKKQTTPQVELEKRQRTENVRGVFCFNPGYLNLKRKYLIILFDDVITTGSTMKEAAKTIKLNLNNSVWGLTIAK